MSHGSQRPARYDRPRYAVRVLRQNLVQWIGCVHESCRDLARMFAHNAEMGYTKTEQRVKIPRSLRRHKK